MQLIIPIYLIASIVAQIIPINNIDNIFYTLNATINNRSIQLVIDTGSSLLVISSNLTQEVQPFNISYNYSKGSCNGFYSGSELIIQDQTQQMNSTLFAQCTDLLYFSDQYGYMGLSNKQDKTNFFELSDQKNIFGLQIYETQQSYFLTQVTKNVSNQSWIYTNSNKKWKLELIGLYFDDEQYDHPEDILFDSGYTCLALPQKLFDQISKVLLSKYPCYYQFDYLFCDSSMYYRPTFVFYYRGIKQTIHPYEFMLESEQYDFYCVLRRNIDYIILGLPGFMNNIIYFDKYNQQIGFNKGQNFNVLQDTYIYFIIFPFIIQIIMIFMMILIHHKLKNVKTSQQDLEMQQLIMFYENRN
ncbi:hypothetical protein pb186bvf_007831 [Paramecium bursaria]